ncbi:hypothetical protein G7046_g7320 [Stylonectria norvegica]|nr:hypothetical protein G7046_g7320 [Stylonectria norvegica]
MPATLISRALINSWSTTPIPSLSISASGLLALADLQTVAHRTVLTGGSTWLDALVLAPGMHYQQACDSLHNELPPVLLFQEPGQTVTQEAPGETRGRLGLVVKNRATTKYLKKLCRDGGPSIITLDVGGMKEEGVVKRLNVMLRRRKRQGTGDQNLGDDLPDMDWLSHALYLTSPLLTMAATSFMVLFEDWWGFAFILVLILSRIMNIWAIKQRSRTSPAPDTPLGNHTTEYLIDLGLGQTVRLRGLNSDLQALTTQAWLRAKTNVDEYLEAAAKLLVYLVAAFSGNLSQVGGIILVALLLVSAALLGLSNAHTKGFRMHGRYVLPEMEEGLKTVEVERTSEAGDSMVNQEDV